MPKVKAPNNDFHDFDDFGQMITMKTHSNLIGT